MSAFQQAVLSVAPERLEQFTMEMKKNINDKSKSSKKKKSSSTRDESSKKKKRKHVTSDHKDDYKKNRKTNVESRKGEKNDSSGKKQSKSSSNSESKNRSRSRRHSSSGRRDRPRKKREKEDSDIDAKDLDLSIPMSPLTDMVKNKTGLLETVFTIIKGPKLTSMLPDILKLMPLEEIKRLCLEQLIVMSSKRILHILSGTTMNSSSGTDSSDGEASSKKKNVSKDSAPASSQDGSLQANFVDSTTEEPTHMTKSMLFPSALSTARASMSNSEIPVKEITNDNVEQDAVSTSTEPNIIYSFEDAESIASDEVMSETSDPEEGEVRSSEDENAESSSDAEEHHRVEEVLVEEEEVELPEEILIHDSVQLPPSISDFKRKRKVVVKSTKSKTVKSERLSGEDYDNLVDEMLEENMSWENNVQTKSTDNNEKKYLNKDEANDVKEEKMEKQPDPYEGKSQLEILELEMRARAIRSLMKAAQANKLKNLNQQ